MIRLSCDDGGASDVRVAELAEKYKIPCVFYWPVEWHSLAYYNNYFPLSYEQALKISRTHEIGSHGVTHAHLTKLPYELAVREIVESKFMLEKLFQGNKIKKFCPSRGYINKKLMDAVFPLYESIRLTKGEGLVHVHPKSGVNEEKHWLEYAKSINVRELWFHSWELDKFNLWDELENYLKEL